MPVTEKTDLSRLLADGRITAITVDTNIFDEKGLQLNSAVLQAISSLRDKHFAFILSETVVREIRRHLEDATETALRSAKKSIGTALNAFETKQPTRDNLLAQISGGLSAAEAAGARLDAYIRTTGCEVLEDATLVDMETIFDAYFAGDPPFGTGAKKCEFPDALALNALEQEAANRQTGIIVVSKDKDWRAFCANSKRLHFVAEIELALALLNDASVVLREALQKWLAENEEGRAEIRPRLESEIEQIEFFVNGYPTSGEMEATAWGGKLTGIDWPDEDEIDIIDIAAAEDGEMQVLLSLPLHFRIRSQVELSFSVWDNVDRESIGLGGRIIEVDEELDVRATITLNVYYLGSEDQEVDFVNVELDSFEHEIELGEVDVFDPEDAWPEDA